MQLSEFTYIFLTLCIPFLIYIVRSTNPKKGFSILFVAIISANIFLIFNNFSQIGIFFLAFYLIAYSRKEKFYYLALAFVSFTVSFTTVITAKPMGKSIIVVAVFMTHMLITAAVIIKPKINEEPFDPALLRTNNAILLCKSHFCIAVASKKPPKNKNILLKKS